jgi:hypothetical protein
LFGRGSVFVLPEGFVVSHAEGSGEVRVKLARLEAAEADDLPEGAGEVASEFVAALRGVGGPALRGGQENGEAGAGFGVPEADGAVFRGGGEVGATGVEGDAGDGGGVAMEGAEGAAGGFVPEADGLVG